MDSWRRAPKRTRDPLNHAARTARILIGVGALLQAAQAAAWLVAGALSSGGLVPAWAYFAFGGVGITWVLLVYGLAYRPLHAGEYARARTPTLILAALSLGTLEILSGLLYLLAYGELRKAQSPTPSASAGTGPKPLASESKLCPACHRTNPTSTTFCQACGFLLG
jgi:hypothetical protein